MPHTLKLFSAGLFLSCLLFSVRAAELDETAALLAKVGKTSPAKPKLSKEEIRQLIFLHSEFSSVRVVTREQRLDVVRALSAQFAAAPRECIAVFNDILAAETSIPARQFGHRFIAACYENLPAPDTEKAGLHLLRFAELRYGKDSEHYAYFLQLKEKGRLESASYADLFRFDAGYAQSKVHLAYWNMKDGDKKLQSLPAGAEGRKQTEAILQEHYASGLSHLSTILGKEQRSQRKYTQLHAALYLRLAANYYKLTQYDLCFDNVQKYMALQGEYARDLTAAKVWFSCADKAADLGAEATDFARVQNIINSRRQLMQILRGRWETEKDEKTKQLLEIILRGRFDFAESEVENWQQPGILFGDKN